MRPVNLPSSPILTLILYRPLSTTNGRAGGASSERDPQYIRHAYLFSLTVFIDSQGNSARVRVFRPPNVSIHILDNYSLLHIFNLCRPNLFEEDEQGSARWVHWAHERWWYKLMKVCQRWRYLILGSASLLGLCLVCSRGTPVAEMLAHSPPFPLIIFYHDNNHNLTPEDEGGIMLALEHRDRVRRIILTLPVPSLRKVIKAMDDRFPTLEVLYIVPPTTTPDPHLVLPATFRAPQLNHLTLNHFASPIISPLLTVAIPVGLARLFLPCLHPSTIFYPNHVSRVLSLLPQLQDLMISFSSPVNNRDVERHMLHTPNATHITIPNLRSFSFGGVSAYLEELLSHMDAPLLQTLSVFFFNQLRFSVTHLRKFVTTAKNLRSSRVELLFYRKGVVAFMYTSVSARYPTHHIHVGCDHFDWQVSSMAQILDVHNPLFSAVVDLTLDYRSHTLSSEWHNQADRTQWRNLLGSFRNIETLRVHAGLVKELSRGLHLDGESPAEILPELKRLICPTGSCDDKTFATFIDDREVAGLPVNLIEEASPAGELDYKFETPAGIEYVKYDPVPVS